MENPIEDKSVEYLLNLKKAISKNYLICSNKNEILEDYSSYFDVYVTLLSYCFFNHKEILKDYPVMNRTFRDIAIIVINETIKHKQK